VSCHDRRLTWAALTALCPESDFRGADLNSIDAALMLT